MHLYDPQFHIKSPPDVKNVMDLPHGGLSGNKHGGSLVFGLTVEHEGKLETRAYPILLKHTHTVAH